MSEDPKPACKHERLCFDRGGLYIQCEDCPQRWAAELVGHSPIRDYSARSWGLTSRDRRVAPAISTACPSATL